jgi:hypothetical protein
VKLTLCAVRQPLSCPAARANADQRLMHIEIVIGLPAGSIKEHQALAHIVFEAKPDRRQHEGASHSQ